MSRNRRKKRKKIIVNKKRFVLSLILIIGIVFILNHSIKAMFQKDSKESIVLKKNVVITPKSHDEEKPNSEEKINIEEKPSEKELKEDKVSETVNVPIEENNNENNANNEKDESNENKNYKEIFKDDLFMGDSITDSLSFYEILEEKNVIAKLGLTVIQEKEKISNIGKTNPLNIYMLFGMNDILTGIGGQKFAENYAELIHVIQQKLPNANIYVQSVLPVSPNVKQKKSLLNNSNVEEFNEFLEEMCKDANVNFVDLRPLLEDRSDLYEPDGIHLKYDFYKLWLDYLIDNTK